MANFMVLLPILASAVNLLMPSVSALAGSPLAHPFDCKIYERAVETTPVDVEVYSKSIDGVYKEMDEYYQPEMDRIAIKCFENIHKTDDTHAHSDDGSERKHRQVSSSHPAHKPAVRINSDVVANGNHEKKTLEDMKALQKIFKRNMSYQVNKRKGETSIKLKSVKDGTTTIDVAKGFAMKSCSKLSADMWQNLLTYMDELKMKFNCFAPNDFYVYDVGKPEISTNEQFAAVFCEKSLATLEEINKDLNPMVDALRSHSGESPVLVEMWTTYDNLKAEQLNFIKTTKDSCKEEAEQYVTDVDNIPIFTSQDNSRFYWNIIGNKEKTIKKEARKLLRLLVHIKRVQMLV